MPSPVPFSNLETYFNIFGVERICVDKGFFTVYSLRYCILNHQFDAELAAVQHFNMKRGAVKKGRFEDMFHRDVKPYLSYDIRFAKTRGMRVYVNIIEYLQDKYNLKPASNIILHDSNFMPLDCTLTIKDYIEALNEVVAWAVDEYIQRVSSFWGESLDDVKVCVYNLEIPFEVYPCSIHDIGARLDACGIAYRSNNMQSGTIYFNDPLGNIDYDLPNGLTTRITEGYGFDSVYVNNTNAGYNSQKIQLKYYQKSFGLVRIEFTIFKEEINSLFSLNKNMIEDDCRAVISWVHKQLRERDKKGCITRFDVSLEAIVKEMARLTGLDEDIIYILKDVEIFESTAKTRHLKDKLVRKGILVPMVDDLGRKRRKIYRVSTQFQYILNSFKPRGHESFLPHFIDRTRLL